MNNWEKRYSNFPQPVDGGQYATDEIAQWLNRRYIRANALLPGEPAGTTYGDRFVRNLSGAARTDGARPHLPPGTRPGWTPGPSLWQELQKHRGEADPNVYEQLLLVLLHVRRHDSTRWTTLARRARDSRSDGFGPELIRELNAYQKRFPHVRETARDADPRRWTGDRLAQIIRILDRATSSPRDTPPTMSREAAICRFLLDRFAAADRVRGGEFSTPDQIVRLMARLLAPQPGDSVYDPCCGNGGLLAGAAADLEERGEPSQRMSFTGQAISERSLRLAKINLAVHGLTTVTDLRWRSALRDDPYRAESFDVVLTNPPFNLKDWSRGDPADDSRWRYGVPPRHSANFAWLQHIAGKLSPHGRAAVLMPNATTVSANPRERGIREAMVDAGVVDSVIMLPGQLFRSTSVPVSLWLLRSRRAHDPGRVLFVDARELGVKEDRAYRELTDGDIGRIVDTYQAWRRLGAAYTGVPGFSATAAKDDIAACAYALAANSYVTPALDNGPRAEETIHRLRAELAELHDRAAAVDALAEHELREVFR